MSATHKPAIILVRTQMGENIGAAARAMSNFGLEDLRLVAPRDGWPNPVAFPSAASGEYILDQLRVFHTLEEATADLHHLYATSARPRDLHKRTLTPHDTAREIHTHTAAHLRCGILFGPERTGLTNEETVLAHTLVHIPTAAQNPSLNIAQACVVLAYEWFAAQAIMPALPPRKKRTQEAPATQEELHGFFDQLEKNLDRVDFFKTKAKKPVMWQNLRSYFVRSQPTTQDIQTLRGVIRELSTRRTN